jgi:hypothetical protein
MLQLAFIACFGPSDVFLTAMYQCLYQFHVSVYMVLSDICVYVQYLNVRTCKYKTVTIIVILLKYVMSVPAWISSVACYIIVVFLYSCPTFHIIDHFH